MGGDNRQWQRAEALSIPAKPRRDKWVGDNANQIHVCTPYGVLLDWPAWTCKDASVIASSWKPTNPAHKLSWKSQCGVLYDVFGVCMYGVQSTYIYTQYSILRTAHRVSRAARWSNRPEAKLEVRRARDIRSTSLTIYLLTLVSPNTTSEAMDVAAHSPVAKPIAGLPPLSPEREHARCVASVYLDNKKDELLSTRQAQCCLAF